MAETPKEQRPFTLMRCFFCGANTKVRTSDPFLLQTQDNGRSFNFCPRHWRALLRYAPAETIEHYRRLRLTKEQPDFQKVIAHLKFTKGHIGLV